MGITPSKPKPQRIDQTEIDQTESFVLENGPSKMYAWVVRLFMIFLFFYLGYLLITQQAELTFINSALMLIIFLMSNQF